MYKTESVDALEYHYSMLMDELRMDTFRRAIDAVVRTGDVVLDLGCGTGILSLFACRAGASKVFAIEQGPVIHLAKELARENGCDDRITFIHDWSTEVMLDEEVDVIISETIGNIGLDEGILRWMTDARTRLLKKGGKLIPSRLDLMMAPSELPQKLDVIEKWPDTRYDIRFGPARRLAANNIYWTQVKPGMLLAEPMTIYTVDLMEWKTPAVKGGGEYTTLREGKLRGFGAWFQADLAEGIRVSNAPGSGADSWMQAFVPLEKPLPVGKGDEVGLRLEISADGVAWRWNVTVEQASSRRGAAIEVSGSTLRGQLVQE